MTECAHNAAAAPIVPSAPKVDAPIVKGGGKGGKNLPLAQQLCYVWSRDPNVCAPPGQPCPKGRAHPPCPKCQKLHPWAHPCPA